MILQVPQSGRRSSAGLTIALFLLVCCCASQFTVADVYSFTDANGVAHFSNVPTDSRFELLLVTPADAASIVANHRTDWLVRATQYDTAINGAAKLAAIQPALVRAVIVVESGFNPQAVSKRGAIGLMQLRPGTAKRYGVKNIFDPEQNIFAGARYLHDLLLRFDGNLELALAAYNAGEEAVEKHGRHVPPYTETMRYVPEVMSIYRHLVDQVPTG